jgi:hypothetical protein
VAGASSKRYRRCHERSEEIAPRLEETKQRKEHKLVWIYGPVAVHLETLLIGRKL